MELSNLLKIQDKHWLRELNSLLSKSYICFIVYALLLTGTVLFVRDVSGQPDLFISINQFIEQRPYPYNDPYSFLQGATDIYEKGWIQPANNWLLSFWPPGFMFLEAMIMKCFGMDAPFLIVLGLLNVVILAGTLMIYRALFRDTMPPGLAFAIPLLPFLLALPRFFLLQPGALMLGEAFSISFFLMAIGLIILAVKRQSFWITLAAAASLALTAYFRSQFEAIITGFTLVLVVFALLFFAFWVACDCKRKSLKGHSSALRLMAIFVISSQLLLLPYRMYNADHSNRGTYSWIDTSLMYTNASKTTEELHSLGGGWLVDGKANLACLLDTDYCGKPSKKGFYTAFLFNAADWTTQKYSVFPTYWFAALDINNLMNVHVPSSFSDYFANGLIALMLAANIVLLWLIRKRREVIAMTCLIGGSYGIYFAIFMLVHFEARYLYALKIMVLFKFMYLFSTWLSEESGRRVITEEKQGAKAN